MARKKFAGLVTSIPPDNRPRGPLTSDDRSSWSDRDPTRGGEVFCSGVMGEAHGRELGVHTVNARRLPDNPYDVGAHEPEAEE
jgi:hypothetical protein